jgi:hypothetical protein
MSRRYLKKELRKMPLSERRRVLREHCNNPSLGHLAAYADCSDKSYRQTWLTHPNHPPALKPDAANLCWSGDEAYSFIEAPSSFRVVAA